LRRAGSAAANDQFETGFILCCSAMHVKMGGGTKPLSRQGWLLQAFGPLIGSGSL
jgi:hypothetical protein